MPEEGRPDELSDILQQIHRVEELVNTVLTHDTSFRNEGVKRRLKQVRSLLKNFEETLRIKIGSNSGSGIQALTEMEELGASMEELNKALLEAQHQAQTRRNRRLDDLLLIGIEV